MSKALEALEKIKRHHIILHPGVKNEDGSIYKEIGFEEEFEIIENAIKTLEQCEQQDDFLTIEEKIKKLNAFEIIKNKIVDVWLLKLCNSLEEYNREESLFHRLTQEEYELLKEIFL